MFAHVNTNNKNLTSVEYFYVICPEKHNFAQLKLF